MQISTDNCRGRPAAHCREGSWVNFSNGMAAGSVQSRGSKLSGTTTPAKTSRRPAKNTRDHFAHSFLFCRLSAPRGVDTVRWVRCGRFCRCKRGLNPIGPRDVAPGQSRPTPQKQTGEKLPLNLPEKGLRGSPEIEQWGACRQRPLLGIVTWAAPETSTEGLPKAEKFSAAHPQNPKLQS